MTPAVDGRAPVPVLYVAWAPFFSGAERALVALLDHLDRSAFAPVVAIGTKGGELEAQLRDRGVPVRHVPIAYRSKRALPAWVASVSRFAGLLRRTRARLVHANDLPSFQPAGYAAGLLRRATAVHIRFNDSAAGFRWFLRPGFDRALFVSRSLEDEAIAATPEQFEGRHEVVYDGVAIPDVPSADERARLRHELQLSPSRPAAALIGQIAEIKGVWEFIDAAGIAAARGAACQFVIVGEDLKGQGALRREAEAVVRDRGLSEWVRFLGFRRDVQRLMPAFDLVAAPSHVEPLGLTMLEGMAAGLPVVGSRVGGIAETVVDDETGLLVPPRDAQALAEAMLALLCDRRRAAALGGAGRKRVETMFGLPRHARQVEAVYRRLLGAAPASEATC